jgi:hypothetical protein
MGTMLGLRLAPAFALAEGLFLLSAGCQGDPPPARSDTTHESPDRPRLRRLTREQYDNTVRDLLGVTGDPAAAFAEDDVQAGFFANTELPVQSLQLEQYQDAAESIAAAVVTSNLSQVIGCSGSGASDSACANLLITGFGERAFRRPLAAEEVARYQQLFTAGAQSGKFSDGAALVLRAMLQSPSFLYRVELGAPGAALEPDGAIALSDHEIATRLSYFVWNTTPDATLLAAADAGQLHTATQVGDMARSMLADGRARDAIASFHEQWLGTGGLHVLQKIDPAFTEDLRAAMQEELVGFADGVIRGGDGRLETLLASSNSYVRAPLYELYGVAPAAGQDLALLSPVLLPTDERAGLLTSAAVLATHAHADQTSLVHRGQLIREQLLCTPLPPPPPDVDTTPPPVKPGVSARERFEQHTASAACSGCHGQMDPLGAPFESYDAIGRFRTKDGSQAVDPTGTLSGSASHDGPVDGALDLVRRLSTDDGARTCMARQWFRFAFGRHEDDADAPTLNAAFDSFKGADYRIPELIVALARSRAFRFRRAP